MNKTEQISRLLTKLNRVDNAVARLAMAQTEYRISTSAGMMCRARPGCSSPYDSYFKKCAMMATIGIRIVITSTVVMGNDDLVT